MFFQELEDMVTKMKNEKEKDLIIENRFHKQLIGPKGENIQKIRDDFSSVQISFPDLGVKSDIVKLRGPKDDVDLCSKTMNKMYKDLLESNYQVCYIFSENLRRWREFKNVRIKKYKEWIPC